MYILITGGLGYIGSHTCVELINNGFNIIIIDSLINSNINTLNYIQKITGKTVIFHNNDIRDDIRFIFDKYKIDTVIHFAGLKSINESIDDPLNYYDNNIGSTLNLLKTMQEFNCYKLIFSSSAAIYGRQMSPIKEDYRIGDNITNPYGMTKFMIEKILMDVAKSNDKWKIISLRYFNPIGAHASGLFGENPDSIPNNLMPYVLRVAYHNNINKINDNYMYLSIFGDDYNTQDGTCRRDFIHVVDLALGHLCAIKYIDNINKYKSYNLGNGQSISILELIECFEKINKVNIPYQIKERRQGDLSDVYCSNYLANKELGWIPKFTIEDMCRDSWNYQLLQRTKG